MPKTFVVCNFDDILLTLFLFAFHLFSFKEWRFSRYTICFPVFNGLTLLRLYLQVLVFSASFAKKWTGVVPCNVTSFAQQMTLKMNTTKCRLRMFPPGNLTLDFCASIHIDFTITVNSLFQHDDMPHKSHVMGHNGSVLPCNNFCPTILCCVQGTLVSLNFWFNI